MKLTVRYSAVTVAYCISPVRAVLLHHSSAWRGQTPPIIIFTLCVCAFTTHAQSHHFSVTKHEIYACGLRMACFTFTYNQCQHWITNVYLDHYACVHFFQLSICQCLFWLLKLTFFRDERDSRTKLSRWKIQNTLNLVINLSNIDNVYPFVYQ